MPSANIKESDEKFELEIAIPGMKKDDFKISLENNILSVSCEKEDERKEEKDNYTRREFAYGSFCRSFNLPKTIDNDKIQAEYTDGILHIALPKKEEDKSKLSRLINVN
jgi:HSP20 family protein